MKQDFFWSHDENVNADLLLKYMTECIWAIVTVYVGFTVLSTIEAFEYIIEED